MAQHLICYGVYIPFALSKSSIIMDNSSNASSFSPRSSSALFVSQGFSKICKYFIILLTSVSSAIDDNASWSHSLL